MSVKDLAVQLEKSVKEERAVKENERFDTLLNLYDSFLKERCDLTDKVYLNKPLLTIAIKSYYDDIYRFKLYSHSRNANKSKKCAFLIKWISKIRPIQLLPTAEFTIELAFVNSMFALFVGFSIIEADIEEVITPKFYKELLYTTFYRDVCPKQLASLMYVLQSNVKKELP